MVTPGSRWVSFLGSRLRLLGALALAVMLGFVPASTAAADIGTEGPSYEGAGASPSGSKPESKLWHNDGSWWGVLWDSTALDFTIWRLEDTKNTWVNTGVHVDTRAGTRADVLWDGKKLYVASHGFALTPVAGFKCNLYRFSYDAALDQYTMDPGFPVVIHSTKVQTTTIEKDSAGKLWATWVQDSRVFVNRTVGDDSTWGLPFILPADSTDIGVDDISGIVTFAGKTGIFWSDAVTATHRFSYHVDGAPDEVWSAAEVVNGGADSHMNLKADSLGRVYAVVKNLNDDVLLFRRDAAGTWTEHLVYPGTDAHTRPILLLHEAASQIRIYTATPLKGGTIVEKVGTMDPILFTESDVPVIRDDDILRMNDATSTKQGLSTATGVAVLATNQTANRYWHHRAALTGGSAPVASFTMDPTSGKAPLSVQFTDGSTNLPTSWSWSFGDGGVSTLQDPEHTFAGPGTFEVTLVAKNSFGSSAATKSITVAPPSPFLTFSSSADAHVNSAYPDKNYGALGSMRVRLSDLGEFRSYAQFGVSGVKGKVLSAKLRLHVLEGSKVGGSVFSTAPGWTETDLTYSKAPAAAGGALSSLGPVATGAVVEFDVTGAVAGDGTYSFVITSPSSDSVYYYTKEGGKAPELIVTFE